MGWVLGASDGRQARAWRAAVRADTLPVDMASLGVFFALTSETARALRDAEDDDELMELVSDIEEAWDKPNLVECDKAWDAMHRALTDGELECGNGPEPLCHCVLGPEQLHEGDEYFVSLVPPEKVKEVAAALAAIDEADFARRYRDVVPHDYAPEYGDEDRGYTWSHLEAVRDFYRKAAADDRWVMFTVDQ